MALLFNKVMENANANVKQIINASGDDGWMMNSQEGAACSR